MAIKISNTVVLDNDKNLINANSGNFTGTSHLKLPAGTINQRPSSSENGMIRYNTEESSFEGYKSGAWGPLGSDIGIVDTPVNVFPQDNNLDVRSKNPLFESSTYYHVYDKNHANSQWQVSTTSNFSSLVVDEVSGPVISYRIVADLTVDTTYYWRVRYKDVDGVWSNYSPTTTFKTALIFNPETLGEPFNGGYYIGITSSTNGCQYYLLLSPNSTGCACCQWTNSSCYNVGTCRNDGFFNTFSRLNNSSFPAANWTATRTINGYSDWYLPAVMELKTIYTNRNSIPAGEIFYGQCGAEPGPYYSSTEFNNCRVCIQNFWNGDNYDVLKNSTRRVRAVRRELIVS
jgi:hypothetical protein